MSGRFNLNDYVSVQERIVQFWKDYPAGRILTTLESDPHDFEKCRYRTEIYRDRDEDRPAATGYAFEVAGQSGANKTSHEENCETSSIGRALANLGYATSQRDRPSREEMSKANRQPPPDEPDPDEYAAWQAQRQQSQLVQATALPHSQQFIDKARAKAIRDEAAKINFPLIAALNKRGLERLGQLTNEQADKLMQEIADHAARNAAEDAELDAIGANVE